MKVNAMLLPRNLGHLQYKPKENVENARFFFFLPPSAAAWASGLSPIRTNGLGEKEKKRLKFLKGKKREGKETSKKLFSLHPFLTLTKKKGEEERTFRLLSEYPRK